MGREPGALIFLGGLTELHDRVREVEMLGRPVGHLEDLRVAGDLGQGALEADRVAGQLDRRRVGQVLALAADRELDQPGGDRGQDRQDERDREDDQLELLPRRCRCRSIGRDRPRT